MSHSEIIDQIRAQHRERCFAMEQRKRLDLALGAFLRLMMGWRKDLPQEERSAIAKAASDAIDNGAGEWADVIAASKMGTKPFEDVENAAKKEMERLAKSLPVWASFGEQIRGFGAGSLAVIIGEAGDLSNYSSHSKLWKRMGLAVMDGVRQGGLKKTSGKDLWIEHGYSPIRRSRMWNIGDTLMKGNQTGPYRMAYLERKQFERDRAISNGLTVVPSAKIPKADKEHFMSDGHVHLRAQRYMEKRLLKHLWQAWRRAIGVMPLEAKQALPVAHRYQDTPAVLGLPQGPPVNAGVGEATARVPAKVNSTPPPHKSKVGRKAKVSAKAGLPKGLMVDADTKKSKGRKAKVEAVL